MLVFEARRRRHVELPLQELIAPAVIGDEAVVLVRESGPKDSLGHGLPPRAEYITL
jgi:hypothetical protein